MKKLQVKQWEFKGEVTAFLSLLFLLMLSVVGVMIQSASIHITKSMKRADTELAMESMFAEYHPKLLKEYEVFAKERAGEAYISQRLSFYGAGNMAHSIEKIELLSDHQGATFYTQVISFMGGEVVEEKFPETDNMEVEAQKAKEELETLLEKEECILPEEDNPIWIVEQLRKLGILSLVLPDSVQVSERTLEKQTLASQRELHTGSGYERGFPQNNMAHKILFASYLNQHFLNFQTNSVEHPLSYEAEYLLAGKMNDRENLKQVANKLLGIRIGLNYTYLLANQEKQAEAMAMALGLSSLMLAPEAAEIVKQAVLFAWAYGESILDLRSLYAGKKVPVVKNDANWTLQLSKLSSLLTKEAIENAAQEEQGLTYQEYLRTLFLLEKEEVLSMRALDLIEVNLGIQVDDCITALQIRSRYEMQRHVKDTFLTEYMYR